METQSDGIVVKKENINDENVPDHTVVIKQEVLEIKNEIEENGYLEDIENQEQLNESINEEVKSENGIKIEPCDEITSPIKCEDEDTCPQSSGTGAAPPQLETVFLASVMENNKKEPNQDGLYECDYCSFSNIYLNQIRLHKRQAHGNLYQCKDCNFCTKSMSEWALHAKNAHNNCESSDKEVYMCPHDDCKFSTSVRSTLYSHINYTHKRKVIKCSYCEYETKKYGSMKIHLKKHKNESQIFRCDKCAFTTLYKTSLVTHYLQHNSINKFTCEECGQVFDFVKSYKDHVAAKHKNLKLPFPCPKCTKFSAKTKHSLERHIEQVHLKKEVLKCDFCQYKTARKSDLKEHINYKHTQEKVFPCTICEHKTYSQKHLRRHVQTAHSEPSLRCSYCASLFRKPGELRAHIGKEHGIDTASGHDLGINLVQTEQIVKTE